MAEGKPGNGNTSPFGNGDGATQSAGASKGCNDFLTNPTGGASKTGGRDFSKDSRPQTGGDPSTINPESVPAGGAILKADPGPVSSKIAGNAALKPPTPFKLNG